MQYCLVGMNSTIEEQNMRRLEKWSNRVYSQGGEAAVIARLLALTRDGNEQDDWSLEKRLLQLPGKGEHDSTKRLSRSRYFGHLMVARPAHTFSFLM